jgi:hypothetical protein
MSYEAHFWIYTKKSDVICVGNITGSLSINYKSIEDMEPLIKDLVMNYEDFLNINPYIELSKGAKITPYVEMLQNRLVINLWLSNRMPLMYANYIGKNFKLVDIKINVESHSWELNKPAHIADVISNLVFIFNIFKKKEKIFPVRTILRFIMYMDKFYQYPYINGYFMSIDDIVFGRKKLLKADCDEYIIEFCSLYQGHYLAINKEKYHSNDDIIENDVRIL